MAANEFVELWEPIVTSEEPPTGELAYELRAWLADADVTDLWRALRIVHRGAGERLGTKRSDRHPDDATSAAESASTADGR